jgi:hypothetical protein
MQSGVNEATNIDVDNLLKPTMNAFLLSPEIL